MRWSWTSLASLSSASVSLVGLAVFRQIMQGGAALDREMAQLSQENTAAGLQWPRLSVLVPARNEAAHIEICLEAILAQNYPNLEVIAIDDNSTDQTPALLQNLARRYPAQLRLVQAPLLPAKWRGKQHALHQGFLKLDPATSWLLFVDADTVLQPGALSGTLAYAQQHRLDLFSLVPRYYPQNLGHRLVLPLVGKFYTLAAFNPFALLKSGLRQSDPTEAGRANGAFILVRRAAFEAIGGFAHPLLTNSLLDDVELARLLRRNGFRTAMNNFSGYARQRPTEDLKALRSTLQKNWFYAARQSWLTLAFVLAFEGWFGLFPLVLLLVRLARSFQPANKRPAPAELVLNLLAVGLNLGQYAEQLRAFATPRRYALFYPLAVFLAAGLILDSAISIGLRHSVQWRGRTLAV